MTNLMTLDEVAAKLRIPRKSVYLWCLRRELASTKVGKYLRIREIDFETFLARKTRAAIGSPAEAARPAAKRGRPKKSATR